MDKVQLIKLMRRKVYWERERDKCFFNIFFWLCIFSVISFKSSNYSGIKKIHETGWSNADGWDKFSYIVDWILLIVFIIQFFFFLYYFIRIQTCSQKLIYLNQQLLKELNGLPETGIKVK